MALSRVRSLDGLYLRGFNTMATTMDPLTLRVDARFKELSESNGEAHHEIDEEQIEENIANFIEQSGGSESEIDYVSEREKKLSSTYDQTLSLVRQKMSLEDIASERQLALGTIIGHVAALLRRGEDIDISYIAHDDEIVETVQEAYDELVSQDDRDMYDQDGQIKLKPLFTMLDGEITYDEIKLALLFVAQ